jgi:hypothetical protein
MTECRTDVRGDTPYWEDALELLTRLIELRREDVLAVVLDNMPMLLERSEEITCVAATSAFGTLSPPLLSRAFAWPQWCWW